MFERLRVQFAALGLGYAPHPDVVPNSHRALRLTELARELGRHDQMHDRIMRAYWEEAENIGDPGVLRRLAGELGLPGERVDEVLDGDLYAERLAGATRQANAIGVNGIPAWLLDGRLLVLGAQPREAFEQAFAQLDGETAA